MLLKIINLVLALIDVFAKYQKRKEQKKHDQQIEQAKQDPYNWFDGNFNGVQHDNAELPSDAAKAKQAGIAKPDKDA